MILAVVLLGLCLLVLLWRARRRHRQDVHAGIVGERPTFSVDPPLRAIGRHGRERL